MYGNRAFLMATAGWLVLLTISASAHAATITVDSTLDDLDQAPNGNCTLREAIVAANTNAAVDGCPAGQPGPSTTDLVVVPAGNFNLTIAGSGENQAQTGDLDLNDRVVIQGAGARVTVIDGGDLDRVFDVGSVVASIADVTIRNGDTGGNGGGIQNAGTLTVDGCAVSGNLASGPGGGIRNDNDISIFDSTLSGNTTQDHGGGMDDHGTSVLENSTLSGNSVLGGGAGGGLYNLGGTSMTAINVTVSGNSSGAGTAIHNGGDTTLANALVVGSCDGTVDTSDGGNLESPGNGCGLNAGSDQVNVADPGLGPLGDNGGGTDTHAVLAGSAAIDAAVAGPCPPTDQRGVPRPFDGDENGDPDCDVGAFEFTISAEIFADGFEDGDTSAWSAAIP